jgi:hypothetical protein
MKRNKFLQGPILPIAAVVLLAMSAVGSTRAAFTSQSDYLSVKVETAKLSVAVLEGDADNAKEIGDGDVLLTNLLGKDETFQIGKTYEEEISAANNGSYDEYVRMIITKSWKDVDQDGNAKKDTSLAPSLIELEVSENWIEDKSAGTDEQAVYYYTKPLAPGEAVALVKSLRVAEDVTSVVSAADTKGTITTTYDYDGKSFSIDAEVDAVQTHNAEDAIYGAWGVKVSIDSDGTLRLAEGGTKE